MSEIFFNREDTINQFLCSQERKEDENGNSIALKALLTNFMDFLVENEKDSNSSAAAVPTTLTNVMERRSLIPFTMEDMINLFSQDPSIEGLVMNGQEVIFRKENQLKKGTDGTMFFGSWPQSESGESEEIEWIVPAVTEKKMLFLSKKAIVCSAFDEQGNDTWEDSDICQWLNHNFYETAFSDKEKEMICLSGSDNIFLLSAQEVRKFIPAEENRKAEAAASAVKNGAGVDRYGKSFWWLRSKGGAPGSIACVNPDGAINEDGFNCGSHFIAIRPAMWVMRQDV